MKLSIRLSEPLKLATAFGAVYVRHIARLPVQGDDKAPLLTLAEGFVLAATLRPARPTLARVQSSCVFGESLHSTECDCRQQLDLALETIVSENGVLVYLFEEGRGAGLANKIEAMRLQQTENLGTDDAYRQLGLPVDPRDYQIAAQALNAVLGANSAVELMTNNPTKVQRLRDLGVNIVGTRSAAPMITPEGAVPELIEKRDRLGHIFPRKIARKD